MIGPLFAALPRPPDADPDPCAACRHVVADPDGHLCCGRLGHATPAAERVAAWVMAGLTSSCPEREATGDTGIGYRIACDLLGSMQALTSTLTTPQDTP